MLRFDTYKSDLLKSADAAGIFLYREAEHTKRRWKYGIKVGEYAPEELQFIENCDLDAVREEMAPYKDALKQHIRDAKGPDDLMAGFTRITRQAIAHGIFQGQPPDVFSHYVHYLETFSDIYASKADAANSEAMQRIVAQLKQLNRFALMGMNGIAYSSDFIFNMNPLEIDEEERPIHLQDVAIKSYIQDKKIPPEELATYVFTDDQLLEVQDRGLSSFIALINPYLPQNGNAMRVPPSILHLIGRAHDAVIARKFAPDMPHTSRGELLKDAVLIEEARAMLLPIFARYPNLSDNIDDFVAASDYLDRQIDGKSGHAAAIDAERDNNVVRNVQFGRRT